MKMRAELFARGHDFDNPVAQLFGVERTYPDPIDRRALGDHLEQGLKADRRIEVAPVTAQMNASQDDLAKARGREAVERVKDPTRLDAARSSARGRHDTKAAELIASLLQLEKRARAALQRDSAELDWRALFAEVCNHHPLCSFAQGGAFEVVGTAQSHHGVDLGRSGEHGGIGLREASGHHHTRVWI